MLLLQKCVILLHAKPSNLNDNHHLLGYGDSSVSAAAAAADFDDTIENNNFDNNADNDNLRNSNNQFTHFSFVVQFIPSLVHVTVLENATANPSVPIAKIRANISATHLDSSNQIRSQNILSSSDNQYYLIEYHLLNHLDIFNVDKKSGQVFLKSRLSNFTYILDVRANILKSPLIQHQLKLSSPGDTIQYSTKVPVYVEVIDINNSEPESTKNYLECVAYENIDIFTPICTAPFHDADRGLNAELTYSIVREDDDAEIESGGEKNNVRIDPKTGSIYRRYADKPFPLENFSEIIVATDHGVPFLEQTISSRFKLLEANHSNNKWFNEGPYFHGHEDGRLKEDIVLKGTELPGKPIANLLPYDAEGDTPAIHILAGDDEGLFRYDCGTLDIAKKIDFSERRIFNLTIMLTDGIVKNYLNLSIIIPKIIREIPIKFNTTNISIYNNAIATEGSHLINISRYAFDTSYAKYKLYSASSYAAFTMTEVNEYSGQVSLAMNIDYKFNGRHIIIFSIEDSRFSSDHYRSFLELVVNFNLHVPYVPTTSTTTMAPTPTVGPMTTRLSSTFSPTSPFMFSSTTTSMASTKPTTTTTTAPTTTSPTTISLITSTITTPKPFTTSTTTTTTTTTTSTTTTTYRPTIPSTSLLKTITVPQASTSTSTTILPPTYFYTTSVSTNDPAYDDPSSHNRWPHAHSPTYSPPYYPHYPPQSIPNFYPPPYLPPQYPPLLQPIPPPPLSPTHSITDTVSVKTLTRIVLGIMGILFFLACTCLLFRCCCRSSREKRYRDKNDALLNRSSFHSQQRLHSHHRSQSPNVDSSMSRNMNSRLSLRTSAHATPISVRGIQSKYSAGDSVSLSAMNERAKHKPLLPPPSPTNNQNSSILSEGDEGLYENAFGPGHPQYLNELRRLKPDFSRMSSHLLANRRQASTSTVNSSINPRFQQSVANSQQTNDSTPSKWGQTFTRKKDLGSTMNGNNSDSSDMSNRDGSCKSDEFSSENHLSPIASDSCQVRIIEQTQQVNSDQRNRTTLNPTSSEGDQSDTEASDSSRLEY